MNKPRIQVLRTAPNGYVGLGGEIKEDEKDKSSV